jgi:hypothetical protein
MVIQRKQDSIFFAVAVSGLTQMIDPLEELRLQHRSPRETGQHGSFPSHVILQAPNQGQLCCRVVCLVPVNPSMLRSKSRISRFT